MGRRRRRCNWRCKQRKRQAAERRKRAREAAIKRAQEAARKKKEEEAKQGCQVSKPSEKPKQCKVAFTKYADIDPNHVKTIALSKHNYYRQAVADGTYQALDLPKGKIPKLTYSPDLACMAQKWSEQCTAGPENKDAVGQNVWW